MEESPSLKFEAEMGCDTCHGDVRKYEPKQCKATCLTCHDEGEDEYDYVKLLKKGADTLQKLTSELAKIEENLSGVERDNIKECQAILLQVKEILGFLKKDASFGLHNPGLFEEYAGKAGELLETAKKILK